MKNFTIRKSSKIIDAVKKINDNKKQFLAVIDNKGVLVGTITDGDIRRGLLSNYTINDSIEFIMNKNPIYELQDFNKTKIKKKMHDNSIRQCPIIDDKKILKKIIFSDNDLNEEMDYPVVIMAGGLGSRMQPITENLPKAMVEVKGKPMLEHIITDIKNEGFKFFYISVNYKSEIIKSYFGNGEKFGISIKYIEEDKQLGTAGALSLINEKIEKVYLVLNCDLVTNVSYKNLIEYHCKNKSNATMAIKRFEKDLPYGVIKTLGSEITSFIEKPIQQYDINAGIYAINSDMFKLIPVNEYFDMTDFFNIMIKNGLKPNDFPIFENWSDLTYTMDIDRINK